MRCLFDRPLLALSCPAWSRSPGRIAGFCDVLASQFGVALRHLDIGMAKQLGKFVKIAAIHHVPGRKGVTQIIKPEALNLRSASKSSILLSKCCRRLLSPRLGGKFDPHQSALDSDASLRPLRQHGNVTHFAFFQLRPNCKQSFAVHRVSPPEPVNRTTRLPIPK